MLSQPVDELCMCHVCATLVCVCQAYATFLAPTLLLTFKKSVSTCPFQAKVVYVRWVPEVAKHEAIFLNGNHHHEVMKLLTVQWTHMQYKKGVQLTKSIYGVQHKDKLEQRGSWSRALNRDFHEYLLGTKVVWELCCEVQHLMQSCVGVPKDNWTWWDWDTGATRLCMALEHQLHLKNKAKLATIVKTLFSKGLGVMKNGQVLPDLYDAVKRCLEGMKLSNKMWETYKVRMPPRADDNTTTSCWGPQEGMGLDLFRKAGTFLHGDHEFLEEMKLKAKEGRQLKKEMSEVEKAHVFQSRGAHMKKLSARVAQINQRKNAQDNDCCVADFDKQMEEE
ncbi:hypothetical protein F5J12DRAFT_779565 [Pisolithus orientalis]|uniref:uncharacterized protein n=1 Tax=Pisolithus orientalis TaxID=936130 RepID=UPI0022241C4D|nr:uncharacterized protein F5J12DRAFT_779565 [Pisolithus orientalis]KAI6030403.1 hypothetical protein F5J12DRAFT_779565 [Pisolithus orientalis]